MFRWIFYLPLSLLASIVCYITNPIVLLFCDEDGELPFPLSLWQTWDNSCNPSEIKSIAPAWLQYDWDKHYREWVDTTPYLHSVGRERWYTECVNNDWTLLDRLKRYVCRCIWLTRNNAYGWCFYILGKTVSPLLVETHSLNTTWVEEVNGDGWMYVSTAPIFSVFGWKVRWNNLLGWKINQDAIYDTRAMIANRIAIRFSREA